MRARSLKFARRIASQIAKWRLQLDATEVRRILQVTRPRMILDQLSTCVRSNSIKGAYNLKFAAQTDKGLRREKNEDAFCINERLDLAVVADGVGGAPAGHIASHLAVQQIEDYVSTRDHSVAPLSTLHDAVTLANDAINKRGRQDLSLRGMATTVVACLLTKERVFVAHVGDSRAYLITTTEITRLTEDHSLVAELLSSGRITPEEARNHPYRHVITRALGIAVRTHVALGSFPWTLGHHLLLCTDGLTEPVADQTIYTAIGNKAGDLQRKCARLIALANAEGGLDNVTVVLAQHT